ncbi:MAG: translocation/assembly module TamB, partial [Planctomycetota bacterium]|nr:translocation/assembly module TamB [Planctomycetota bacterium]
RVTAKGGADGLRATVLVDDVAPHADVRIPGASRIDVTATRDGVMLVLETPASEFGVLKGTVRSTRGIDWSDPGEWNQALEEAEIDGEAALDIPNLTPLKRLVADVRHVAGRGRVVLRATGPVTAPKIEGGVTLDGLELKLAGELPPFEKGHVEATLLGEKLTIERLQGELGYAPISLSGTYDRAGDGPPRLDLKLVGKNAQLVRNRHLRMRADVDLALAGPWDALVASGTVKVMDALYSRPMELFAKSAPAADNKLQLFSVRTEPFRSMKLDVKVEGDRSFRIRNNVIRGDFSLDLTVHGTGEVPEPRGTIFFRETLVKLPFSSLKVDRGEVTFTADDPFAPKLNVASHTRMKGYDLNVLVEGTLPDVSVFISSKPTLSQDDGVLLLTTGSTRAELEGAGIGRAALTKIGAYFGKQLVQKVSGPSDPDERTLFDRFSFEMGRDISRTGQETIEGEFELSKRYYLRGERDRYDDYNLGIVWRVRFK